MALSTVQKKKKNRKRERVSSEATDSPHHENLSYKQPKKRSATTDIIDVESHTTDHNSDRLDAVNRVVSKSSLMSDESAAGQCTKRLIVVLEGAQLETVKLSTTSAKSGQNNQFGLLNVEQHANMMRKMGRDMSSGRPDITHQCLMMLLDSPLNRAGLLQIYIHTSQNVLIEVHPQTRIPRVFSRFAGLMVQLLHKYTIRATDTSAALLKVIKNPVLDHLPVGCPKLLMTYTSDCVVKACDVASMSRLNGASSSAIRHQPVCVVIGAVAKGSIKADFTESSYCIGNYPLSASITCTKLTSAFEEEWGVF